MACSMHVPLAILLFFGIVYSQSVIEFPDPVNDVTDIKLKDKTPLLPLLDEDADSVHLLDTVDLSNIAKNDFTDVENTNVTSDDLFRRRRKRRRHGRRRHKSSRRRHGRRRHKSSRRRHGRRRHKKSRRRHGHRRHKSSRRRHGHRRHKSSRRRHSHRRHSSHHRGHGRSRRHGKSHHWSHFFHHFRRHHDGYHGYSYSTTTEALTTSTEEYSNRLVNGKMDKVNDVNAIKLKNEIPPLDEDADSSILLDTEVLSNIAKNDFNDVENNVTSDD